MKMKKMLSALCALALSVSAFAGLTATVSAAETEATIIYERAAFTEEDITDWAVDNSSFNLEIDANSGMRFNPTNPSSSYSASKTFDVSDSSIVTYDVDWHFGSSTGRDTNFEYIQFGSALRLGWNSNYRVYASTDAGVNYSTTTLFSGGNSTYVKNVKVTINTISNRVVSVIFDGNEVAFLNNAYLGEDATANTLRFGFQRGGRQANWGYPCGIKTLKVSEVITEEKPVDYTVNYVCGDTEVKTVIGSGVPGTVPTVDTEVFYVDGVKYFYVSDNTADLTVAEDGSTVVTVVCREAEAYTAKITSSIDGAVIASADAVEGDNVTLYYHRYIVKDGVAYLANTESGKNNTGYTRTLSYEAQSKEVPYEEAYADVAFFSEAEDIDTMTAADDTARCSDGKGAYVSEDSAKVTMLTPGEYKLIIGHRADAETITVNAGETEILSVESHGYWQEDVADFVVKEDADITFAAFGNRNKLLDYVLIVKTGDIAPEIETAVAAPEYVEGDDGSYSAFTVITVNVIGDAPITSITYDVVSSLGKTANATWQVPDGVVINGDAKAGLIVNGLTEADETVEITATAN